MTIGLLSWFDHHPLAYWAFAYGAAAFLLGYTGWILSQWDPKPRWKLGEIAAFILILLVLLAGRWPILCASNFLNPDESQQIAGGITLLHDPVFWRSVDGATAGPVNFYLLSLPGVLGFSVNYFTARLTGLILIFGGIWFTYRTVRLAHPHLPALLGSTPLLLFFAWVTDGDLVHFSTEHAPIFLISCSIYYLLRPLFQQEQTRKINYSWAIAGLSTGLMPWAKLQSSVAMLALTATALLISWRDQSLSVSNRWSRLASFLIALLAPSLFFLLTLAITGVFNDFYQSYIVSNFVYVQSGSPLKEVIQSFIDNTRDTGSFPSLVIVTGASIIAVIVNCVMRKERPSLLLVFSGLWVVLGVCTSLSPRRGFPHYLLFMTMPMGFFIAAAFCEIWKEDHPLKSRQVLKVAVFCLVGVGVILGFRQKTSLPFTIGGLVYHWRAELSSTGNAVQPYIKKGDRLAVWGWYPHLHVELGIPQATRDAHSNRAIEPTPQRAYYQQRYLSDLKLNRPAVFVDAVGPDGFLYFDRKQFGHEFLPDLRTYISRNYTLVADVGMSRVYVRRDRVTLPLNTSSSKLNQSR